MNTKSQIKKATKATRFIRHSTQQCPNHPMCGLPKGHDLSKCCVIPPDDTDKPPKIEKIEKKVNASNVDPFKVNFEGYDMYKVIRKLWENSKIASFHGPSYLGAQRMLSDVDIGVALSNPKKDIDYLKGRVFKTSFASFPILTSYGYDRDNGTGAMQKVLDNMNGNKNY